MYMLFFGFVMLLFSCIKIGTYLDKSSLMKESFTSDEPTSDGQYVSSSTSAGSSKLEDVTVVLGDSAFAVFLGVVTGVVTGVDLARGSSVVR